MDPAGDRVACEFGDLRRAIRVIRALVFSTSRHLRAASSPPPTITTLRPSSFRNIGKVCMAPFRGQPSVGYRHRRHGGQERRRPPAAEFQRTFATAFAIPDAMSMSTPIFRSGALPDAWTLVSVALACVLLMPIAAIAWIALFPSENIWPHLAQNALPTYLSNTLILMAMTGIGAAMVGTGAAWLVTMTDFPGRRWLEWALLAPLAMPAYIGAYALVDLLEYAGPVQTAMRSVFGWTSARDYWFPQIRSIGGAGFVLTLALYPYVYLLTRAAFHEQSVCALEVGRALGCGPWGVFRRVGLPLARPAVVAGTAIVCMETMADFGAVDYFAVPTLTRGVFSIWLDMHNAGGAAQISLVMLGCVMAHAGDREDRPPRQAVPPHVAALSPDQAGTHDRLARSADVRALRAAGGAGLRAADLRCRVACL